MKKDEQFVKLVMKNFFKQKLEEIFWIILGAILFVILPIIIFNVTNRYFPSFFSTTIEAGKCVTFFYNWFCGILVIYTWFILILIGLMIFMVLKLLYNWIKSNFEKAIKEAKKELKIK